MLTTVYVVPQHIVLSYAVCEEDGGDGGNGGVAVKDKERINSPRPSYRVLLETGQEQRWGSFEHIILNQLLLTLLRKSFVPAAVKFHI